MADLNDLFNLLAEEKKKQQTIKAEQQIIETFSKLLSSITIKEEKPSLIEISHSAGETQDIDIEEISSDIFIEEHNIIVEETIPEKQEIKEVTLGLIGGNTSTKTIDPLTPLNQNFVTFDDLQKHYKTYLARIQQQMSTLGGGGEVNFRYLDDVDRSTMSSQNDNWVLEYNALTKRVQFTNKIGPIDRVSFDLNHEHDEIRTVGTLCWSSSDDTLNLEHTGGVTQQIGQELYAYVRNRSGSTIQNGTVVRFDGAEQNGTSRLLIAPFLGDGTYPSLYGLGITTQDIDDDDDGYVTVWGKIRNIDTSLWNVGDILYVSANTAGELTNLKPTAPNNVIPVAAVLRKSVLDGEIFVRPTIEQQKYYGRFGRTTTQTANTINTGYPIVFNDTEISNGVNISSPSSRIVVQHSGFYQFDSSVQITATSNKGIVYVWYRKNEEDVPLSSRSTTVTNGDVFTLHTSLQLSLDVGDHVEVIWATTASGIVLQAQSSPTVGPTVASALLSVAQLQL